VWNSPFIYRFAASRAPAEEKMTATQAWFVTATLVVGALVVFFFLGWDLAGSIGSALHGLEHFLGQPLLWRSASAMAAVAPPS
jgi:type VI protein secretion system component VasF